MTKDEMHALLATIYPPAKKRERHMTTEADWNEAEDFFGVKFPDAYKLLIECLPKYTNCGYISEVGGKYGIVRELESIKALNPDWEDDHIPFGDMGCGDYIIWKKSELPEGKIYIWHLEQYDLTVLGDSLESWLRLLSERTLAGSLDPLLGY